jgi:hypothetical protein
MRPLPHCAYVVARQQATARENAQPPPAHACLKDSGCGAVNMALLASAPPTQDTLLWTIDKNLDALAARLGAAFSAALR